jgi:hypothetical protein
VLENETPLSRVAAIEKFSLGLESSFLYEMASLPIKDRWRPVLLKKASVAKLSTTAYSRGSP